MAEIDNIKGVGGNVLGKNSVQRSRPGAGYFSKCFGYCLAIIGLVLFLIPGLNSLFPNALPRNFEWPPGDANNIISAHGLVAVPLAAPGRIQIYNSNYVFMYGWNVPTGGGVFKIALERYPSDGNPSDG